MLPVTKWHLYTSYPCLLVLTNTMNTGRIIRRGWLVTSTNMTEWLAAFLTIMIYDMTESDSLSWQCLSITSYKIHIMLKILTDGRNTTITYRDNEGWFYCVSKITGRSLFPGRDIFFLTPFILHQFKTVFVVIAVAGKMHALELLR